MPRTFPRTRLRRNRAADFSRRLVRENELTSGDLIYPMFVIEGEETRDPVPSMPGIERLTIDLLVEEARQVQALGIPAIALFPNVEASLRTASGEEAWNPDGLIPRAVQALKALNFRIIAAGDSYNDTTMLAAADHGILFRPPDNVIAEFPQFPVMREYDVLKEHLTELLAG